MIFFFLSPMQKIFFCSANIVSDIKDMQHFLLHKVTRGHHPVKMASFVQEGEATKS